MLALHHMVQVVESKVNRCIEEIESQLNLSNLGSCTGSISRHPGLRRIGY